MTDTQLTEYPFKLGLEEKEDITEGFFSKVKHFRDDPRWIVKEYDQVNDLAMAEWRATNATNLEEEFKKPKMSFERFTYQVKKDEELLKKFGASLLRFIPEHHLVFGTNPDGEKRGFLAMKRVIGEDVEIMKEVPQELVTQLEEVITEAVKFYEMSQQDPIHKGLFPDLMPIQDDDNERFGNLMWGEVDRKKGLYLIDTYPLRHFKDSIDLALEMRMMMRRFEMEKGVKFSDGFIEKTVAQISSIKS